MLETLLIHGWGFSAECMQNILSLEEQRTIDLYSLPKENTFEENIKHIANTITKPVNIVAWSLGGLYAIKLTSLFPEKINNVLLIASTPFFMQESNWQGIKNDQLNKLRNRLKEKPEQALNQFAGWCCSGENTKQELLFAKTRLANNINSKTLLALLSVLENIDVRKDLNKITKKTKLVLASNDVIVANNNVNVETITLSGSHMLPFYLNDKSKQDLKVWLHA